MRSLCKAPRPLLLIFLFFASAAMFGQSAHYSGAQMPLPTLASYPTGVALDKNGNLFSVDNQLGEVAELTNTGQALTVANGHFFIQGLDYPWGIAVDNQGNIYITETGVEGPVDVVKETVSTSQYGTSYSATKIMVEGYTDPGAIAVDSAGKLYLSSYDRIFILTPSGSGYLQSTLPTHSTVYPSALAVDSTGAVYIADSVTNTVLKETPSGSGYVESTVASKLSETPESLAVDGSGNVYIDCYLAGNDAEGFFILKETPSQGGYRQSMVALVDGSDPWSIAVDGTGVLYGGGSHEWEKLVPDAGAFTPVIAGVNPYSYSAPEIVSLLFTIDAPVILGKPTVLTQGVAGLDFRDYGYGSCTTLPSGAHFQAGQSCSVQVEFYPQWAGLRSGSVVLQDSAGNALAAGLVSGSGVAPQIAFLPATRSLVKAGLPSPSGTVVDAQGNIFFAGNSSGIVYKGTRSGSGYVLTEIASGLNHPSAVALDGLGNLFVAGANTVYQETLVSGHYVQTEPVSIPGQLNGISVDGGGNLYIASAASGDIHKEMRQPDGTYAAGPSIGFGISGPAGVAVDAVGDVFVTDPRQGEVYEETLQFDGSYRQTVVASGLAEPEGVALDASGSAYITSATGGQLYRELPQGNGSWVQSVLATNLNGPDGVGVDFAGNIYVSLTLAEEIDKLDVADPPILNFTQTAPGSTSTDSPKQLTVLNTGNLSMYFFYYGKVVNPTLSTGFSLNAETTCPVIPPGVIVPDQLNAGATCDYAIDFTPAVTGPTRGLFGLMDSHLNAAGGAAKQSVELREAGIASDETHTSVRVTPSPVPLGLGVEASVTVSDTSYLPTVPQGGGVTFTDSVSGKTTALNNGVAVAIANGKATLNFVPSVAGAHTLTAHYGGVDAHFVSSTGVGSFTVTK